MTKTMTRTIAKKTALFTGGFEADLVQTLEPVETPDISSGAREQGGTASRPVAKDVQESLGAAPVSQPAPILPIFTGTDGNDTMDIDSGVTSIVLGLGGNDFITLSGGASYYVDAGDGRDTIRVTDGTLHASGGDGDDRFGIETNAAHVIDGGDGTDLVSFIGFDVVNNPGSWDGLHFQIGDDGTDTIELWDSGIEMTATGIESYFGSVAGDYFVGGAGDDFFWGVAGKDYFWGGDGNDTFWASADGSQAHGAEGNDVLYGSSGEDAFNGWDGNDSLYGASGNDRLHGGDGDDFIDGGAGDDFITAGRGADIVQAGAGADRVNTAWSGQGSDWANDHFDGGDDPVGHGNDASDTLIFAADSGLYISSALGVAFSLDTTHDSVGIDTFENFEIYHGSMHDDFIRGRNSMETETFHGGWGDDIFYASSGHDIIDGGWSSFESDTVDYSGVGTYSAVTVDLSAEMAEFSIYTHDLFDIENVIGGDFADRITGNDRENRIEAGAGNDVMTGAEAADIFVFNGDVGYDRITDFASGEDMIELIGLHRTNGTLIDGVEDLDTNGNGVLDNNDGVVVEDGFSTFVMLDEGIVELSGVTGVTLDDFILG